MAPKNLMSPSSENLELNCDHQAEFDKKIAIVNTAHGIIPTGTIYIGHIPHGFFEDEIRTFFTQFGVVNKVRLARSKKTGGHKGYGYVQFANDDVAKIAAEAMNNYLMFDKLLKCEFVPDDKLHPNIWKGANKKFVWLNKAKRARNLHNKFKTKEAIEKSLKRLTKRDHIKRKKMLACGINYEFPGYAGSNTKKRKLKKITKSTSKEIVTAKAGKKKRTKKDP